MDITPATTGTAASANKSTATDTKTATDDTAAAVTGDFQTFLTLLTAQMRNQDPLKPLDSTQFVAQLASFSGVEQQIRSNDKLDGILSALSGSTSAGLADWIGKKIQVAAKADFAGDPIDVGVTPVADADKAVLVVRNDFDQVVARQAVTAGSETVTWDGHDDLGSMAPDGRYGFTLESYQGDKLLDSQAGKVFTTVREVRFADGAPVLMVDDGSQVKLDQVGALR